MTATCDSIFNNLPEEVYSRLYQFIDEKTVRTFTEVSVTNKKIIEKFEVCKRHEVLQKIVNHIIGQLKQESGLLPIHQNIIQQLSQLKTQYTLNFLDESISRYNEALRSIAEIISKLANRTFFIISNSEMNNTCLHITEYKLTEIYKKIIAESKWIRRVNAACAPLQNLRQWETRIHHLCALLTKKVKKIYIYPHIISLIQKEYERIYNIFSRCSLKAIKQGKLQLAYSLVGKIQVEIDQSNAYYNIAVSYTKTNQFDKAIEVFHKYKGKKPLLHLIYAKLNQLDKAYEYINTCDDLENKMDMIKDVGCVCAEQGKFQEPVSWFFDNYSKEHERILVDIVHTLVENCYIQEIEELISRVQPNISQHIFNKLTFYQQIACILLRIKNGENLEQIKLAMVEFSQEDQNYITKKMAYMFMERGDTHSTLQCMSAMTKAEKEVFILYKTEKRPLEERVIYSEVIPDKLKRNISLFSLSRTYFEQQNEEAAISILLKIDKKHYLSHLYLSMVETLPYHSFKRFIECVSNNISRFEEDQGRALLLTLTMHFVKLYPTSQSALLLENAIMDARTFEEEYIRKAYAVLIPILIEVDQFSKAKEYGDKFTSAYDIFNTAIRDVAIKILKKDRLYKNENALVKVNELILANTKLSDIQEIKKNKAKYFIKRGHFDEARAIALEYDFQHILIDIEVQEKRGLL